MVPRCGAGKDRQSLDMGLRKADSQDVGLGKMDTPRIHLGDCGDGGEGDNVDSDRAGGADGDGDVSGVVHGGDGDNGGLGSNGGTGGNGDGSVGCFDGSASNGFAM
ncbi:hypothetical protein chiPu_0016525 [Chiloscyllium punctatum]|uniref:Uncharacterized protein n=1 Tax=Chiloscyllium punctatum TaxID=137246 RepID=A0A401T5Z7_CHIPU|nr:hypothetical protein [Chiloscyllium punctatum]